MGEKRDAYVEKLKAKIDEWNVDIDKLESKAGTVKADAKVEYQKRIQELKAKREQLNSQLAKMSKAGGKAFEDLKAGAELAWKALGESIKSAKTRFKQGK